MIFLSSLVHAFLFWGISGLYPADVTTIDSYAITQAFDQYASYAGIAFAVLSLLLMFILSGVFSLFGMKKHPVKTPLLMILGFSPWIAFGYQLLYREPRYANIAKAIIEYLGLPLFYSSLIMLCLAVVYLIIQIFRPSSASS